MKILFIANNKQNDFLSDAVFHGLLCMDNVEVVDYNPLWYMYNDIGKNTLVNRFHGRGFTYYASLPPNNVDRNDIENKIRNRYFDTIIYGNIQRNSDLKEIVFQYYNEDNIIVLDGQDETSLSTDYILNTIYFKREFILDDYYKYPFIKPISFAQPQNKIVGGIVQKEKLVAHVIPGVSETFIFTNEDDYFEDYAVSLFGFTWKKSGWDCLRHYEIISSACMPLFLDIEKCPPTICSTYPKDILIEYYKKSGLYDIFNMGGEFEYDERNTMITNRDLNLINNLEIDDNFYRLYSEYMEKLISYTKTKLTTRSLAEYVLSFVKKYGNDL
jgi:hypothetical protein